MMFRFEWLLLLRKPREWLYPLGFALIVICLFPFALNADPMFLKNYIPGCIWMTAVLASLISIDLFFVSEIEDGKLEQLLLHPELLLSYLSAKLTVRWLMTSLPLILLTPLLGVLFQLSFTTCLTLMAGLLLGTPVLVLLGAFGAAITLGLKQQGMLLSVLILPLIAPILIFGVSLVQQSQLGQGILTPILFLSGISVLAITLLPLAIAAAIKLSVDE